MKSLVKFLCKSDWVRDNLFLSHMILALTYPQWIMQVISHTVIKGRILSINTDKRQLFGRTVARTCRKHSVARHCQQHSRFPLWWLSSHWSGKHILQESHYSTCLPIYAIAGGQSSLTKRCTCRPIMSEHHHIQHHLPTSILNYNILLLSSTTTQRGSEVPSRWQHEWIPRI